MAKRRLHIYTSYYQKMANRHKGDNDVYIQVSRTLGFPIISVDGEIIHNLIDASWAEEFGMYSESLEEYEHDLDDQDLEDFVEALGNLDSGSNVFLLCFENLDKTYTKADEVKYKGKVKAGEKKQCHRTVLAKVLNKRFNLGITEYKGN